MEFPSHNDGRQSFHLGGVDAEIAGRCERMEGEASSVSRINLWEFIREGVS
jgi:hypothetical protein